MENTNEQKRDHEKKKIPAGTPKTNTNPEESDKEKTEKDVAPQNGSQTVETADTLQEPGADIDIKDDHTYRERHGIDPNSQAVVVQEGK